MPPNVHVETWVPHDDAAAAADVIICHGGYGSTLGTLAHGVPLVVLPLFSSDQWANGGRRSPGGSGDLPRQRPHDALGPGLPGPETLGELAGAVERISKTTPTGAGRKHRRCHARPPLGGRVGSELETIAAEGR